jgi:uncharacterized protein YqcC (DUF446 family)
MLPGMQPAHEVVAEKIAGIEAEMRRIGMWQNEPMPQEKIASAGAFGQGSMAFEQWLQFVFVPRANEIVAARGKFPSKSQVWDQAYREWRMWGEAPDVDRLLELLREFDGLFR